MDIVSHALWANAIYLRALRRDRWWAVAFAILPDLIPFGPFFFEELATHGIGNGPPQFTPEIYAYVWHAYQFTHSLVVFLFVFLFVSLVRGVARLRRRRRSTPGVSIGQHPVLNGILRPSWPLLAWGLHILVDIPTHRRAFFPTPFLWPISDVTVDAISWADPRFFYPNLLALTVVYLVIGIRWAWKRHRLPR